MIQFPQFYTSWKLFGLTRDTRSLYTSLKGFNLSIQQTYLEFNDFIAKMKWVCSCTNLSVLYWIRLKLISTAHKFGIKKKYVIDNAHLNLSVALAWLPQRLNLIFIFSPRMQYKALRSKKLSKQFWFPALMYNSKF